MNKWIRALLTLVAIGAVCYIALVAAVYLREAALRDPGSYDSIIVLGCQVKPDGNPSLQLEMRVNKALEMYQANPCPIAVSGAQGADEPDTEAAVMRRLLLENGVPDSDIVPEDQSVNTRDNIRNAWALLTERECRKPLLITSDYHLQRALWIAADEGIQAEGTGAPCRPELPFWMKNHCREAMSWVKYYTMKLFKLPL